LREADSVQQCANQSVRKDNKSGFKGVRYPRGKMKKFQARIRINGVPVHLGAHNSAIEAAIVYDEAALQHYGEFAVLNFPNRKRG
jgi:hypothetical protein